MDFGKNIITGYLKEVLTAVLFVFVENAGHGSDVGAPIARDIFKDLLLEE